MRNFNPLAWEEGFPAAYANTSVSFLKHCRGFYEAKAGNLRAALEVASNCVNSLTIDEISLKYPDAILLPVISDNMLPYALTQITGMKSHTGVFIRNSSCRKSLSAMERLLHTPVFEGHIPKGKKYVIVDDIITQGGTVSSLRKYVISSGSSVSAILTLSCSAGSKILAPAQHDISSLINKFNTIIHTLRVYNIAHDPQELTNAQIKYLLRFKEIHRLISKIEKTKIAGITLSEFVL